MNKTMKDWTPEAKKRHAERMSKRDKERKDSGPDATIIRQRYLAKIKDDFPRY